MDNADGFCGVIVYGNQTFPVPSPRGAIGWTLFGDGQGPYSSSVRPFQPVSSNDGDVEDTDLDPPQTYSYSLASSVPPFQPANSDDGDVEDTDWDPLHTANNSPASLKEGERAD